VIQQLTWTVIVIENPIPSVSAGCFTLKANAKQAWVAYLLLFLLEAGMLSDILGNYLFILGPVIFVVTLAKILRMHPLLDKKTSKLTHSYFQEKIE
jgi:hypothetical protein